MSSIQILKKHFQFLASLSFALYLLGGNSSHAQIRASDPLPANAFIELAKDITPIVVNISTASAPRRGYRGGNGNPGSPFGRDPFFEMFEQFLGPQQQIVPQQALGTGFIIRSNGLILTNNHVVEGADVIKVQLSENDKTMYTAELIGRDRRSDLALIKIDAKKPLAAAKMGSSKDLQVGEWVAAFGNPFGHGHTMTKGIVSAIGRQIDELNKFPFIQTDASINPGNSGGPLVNLKGEVIGVNSAIDARAQGIGFAIPVDEAKSVIAALEKDGSIRRAFIGVNMYPYPVDPRAAQEMNLPTTTGALIIGTLDNSPADKAGLKAYDLITKFNGKEISNSEDFSRAVQDSAVGQSYKVDFYRGAKKMSVDVKLTEHPDDLKEKQASKKIYRGQKAPFELGFTVQNMSQDLAREFGLQKFKKTYPVVIDVESDSPAERAGLGVGDVIIDVNRTEVENDIGVLKALKNNQINSLRIVRGVSPMLIYISNK